MPISPARRNSTTSSWASIMLEKLLVVVRVFFSYPTVTLNPSGILLEIKERKLGDFVNLFLVDFFSLDGG
jgi:hypothetical protein